MIEHLIDRCRLQGWTIAVAESCTGGLLGGSLTAIAGSSDVFAGGVIAYSNAAKTALLDVPASVIDEHGAVSAQVAGLMAAGIRRRLASTIGIAITGVAGPGHSAGKPEGLVWFGLSCAGRQADVRVREFGPLGREIVREKSVSCACGFLGDMLDIKGG